ncbi:lymphoid organ expressed yellow head virus receptor protein [Musa troglodytarum]|uniref:Lymphoid organ expressed yellow head virus receptor protein n=1 Tax=Musa troglodytarum TaxID=320322 RepID=A0A9E7KSQ4_9LILI|nr:lymphoid organ expressed yellow head virus receptor protein [Musa troglodytarum]
MALAIGFGREGRAQLQGFIDELGLEGNLWRPSPGFCGGDETNQGGRIIESTIRLKLFAWISILEMESGDGVEVELNKGTMEEAAEANGSTSLINKENAVTENGTHAVHADSGSEDTSKVVLDSSVDRDEGPTFATENKVTDSSKGGGSDRFKKIQKNSGRLNGSIIKPQKKRNVLSQSFSFSSKGSLAINLHKSTTSLKQSKVASSITNASRSGDPAANHSAFTTAPSAQKTRSVNTGLVEATSNGSPVEDAHANDGKTKTLSCTLPAKEDDDAHSAASSSTPRARKNTGNGFNFKLDERAEKRKEFFMKLEEKNHAKELEKTNLQAKSKENQEAEIRRLRKSLTFKATPMPSFYQEPGPPKVELKKIPPTRARSPKLGRGKQSVAAASNPSEAGDSCQSPCVTASSTKMNDGAANSKRNAMASKNTKQKSLSKLPSQKSKTTKLDAQSLEPKVHQVKTENGDDRTTEVSAETGVEAVPASPEDVVKEDQTIANFPEANIAPQQVPVQAWQEGFSEEEEASSNAGDVVEGLRVRDGGQAVVVDIGGVLGAKGSRACDGRRVVMDTGGALRGRGRCRRDTGGAETSLDIGENADGTWWSRGFTDEEGFARESERHEERFTS